MNEELIIVSQPSKVNIFLYLRKVAQKLLRNLHFLPIGVALVCLSLPLGLLIFQTLYHPLEKKFKDMDAPVLNGALNEAAWPSLNFKQFLSGEWQRMFEQWLIFKIPFRATIIRLHNQVYYSAFSASYMYLPFGIAIGKDHYVFPENLIVKYCNPPDFNTNEASRVWSSEMQVLSDFLKKRGQQFVYLSSPSKVTYFPEFLPKTNAISGSCRPAPYIPLTHLFTNSLAFVDVRENIIKAKSTYGYLLFPHNGLHWTKLAGILATQAFIDQLNISMKKNFPAINYSLQRINEEMYGDNDLIFLANLFRPNFAYPSAIVKIKYPLLRKTKPFKLAIVGDSMSGAIIETLIEAKIFDQIDFYFYYTEDHRRWKKSGSMITLPVNEADKYQALRLADVVLLEENEVIRGSNHAELLFQSIIGRPSLFKKYNRQ